MSANQPRYGAAWELTAKILGGPVNETDTVISVGTTPVLIAKGFADRVGLAIINLGSGNVFANFDSMVSSTNGILLKLNGGSVTLNSPTDFTLTARAWWAVSDANGPYNVLVIELARFAFNPQ